MSLSFSAGSRTILQLLPVVVGASALLVAWRWERGQADEAGAWRDRAQRCVALVREIQSHRQQPRRYEDRVLASHTVVSYVEQACAQAGLPLNQILAIRPEPPQRVRDSAYVESLVRVRLAGVSLQQLARLVFYLESEVPGLTVSQVRLWTASAEAPAWEAELSMVGVAFIPPQEAS
ncbi:MAG: hypothetical protein GVY24_08275 [Planctomycetes bacterium]|nr:hypothetical protein [Planctomycetota bacterium]